MRLISYAHGSGARGGIAIDTDIYDLEALLDVAPEADRGSTHSVREFLSLYGDSLEPVGKALVTLGSSRPETRVGDRRELRLAAPVTNPAKVLCVGLNYRDHVMETGRSLPQFPDLFAKFASTMIAAEEEISGLEVSENLDFEGEVAVVIGRPTRGVDEDKALDYVAGLAPLNDISARDLQFRGTQWLAGKAVDGSTPWGPELVTLDEIDDPQSLEIVTRVNGTEMQHSNTRNQIFTIAHIVSYVSSFMSLAPGDVITTGTPEGIGSKRTPPIWLQPGDEVEVEVERLGVLRNRVRGSKGIPIAPSQ